MKYLKTIFLLTCAVCLSGCSFFYSVVIVNDSDAPLEVHLKVDKEGSFADPLGKSVADWKLHKSLRRFWTEEKEWEKLSKEEYQINLETREQTIKIAPRQAVQIYLEPAAPSDNGDEVPLRLEQLKIIAPNGEIFYKGKLLPKQFEKDGYTLTKVYENENTK